MAEISGIAHIQLCVSDMAVSIFEDPDGLRIEVNFVPGKGLLSESPNSA